MNKKILSVYVNLQDERLNLPDYLADSKFIISICPASTTTGKLTSEGVTEIKELLDRGCLLGQRGYKGRCGYTHRRTDPWHENLCLYSQPLGMVRQLDLMSRGKKLLTATFGRPPEVYAPINHLYDEDTLEIAQQLGYKFMMEQSNAIFTPYERQGLVIVPESKIQGNSIPKSSGIYSHASELREKLSPSLLEKAELALPGDMELQDAPAYKLRLNEFQKRAKKYARDLKNIILSYTKK